MITVFNKFRDANNNFIITDNHNGVINPDNSKTAYTEAAAVLQNTSFLKLTALPLLSFLQYLHDILTQIMHT